MKHCLTYFLILSVLSVIGQSNVPEDFIDELISIDFVNPIGIQFDNNGQGYIWEKDGKVWTLSPEGEKSDRPLLDISQEVASYGDHGLVGFALDPAFMSNGFYYVFYSVDRHHMLHYGKLSYDANKTISSQASISRITRYTAHAALNFRQTIPDSRKVLVGDTPEDGLPILMTSHATGSLVFGQDGTLLFTFGDGASFSENDVGNAKDTYHEQALEDGIMTEKDNVGSFRSMQISNPHGKVMRIDPTTGEGLPSNPFYLESAPRSHQSRIWSLGFRNPYKFMLLPNTGSHSPNLGQPGVFFVGDVGGAQWEELNIIEKAGEWHGWPIFEGNDYRWGNMRQYDTPNLEIRNPEECSDYFTFNELWQDVRADGIYTFTNPCDTTKTIDHSDFLRIHKRPTLSYSSDAWNPPTRTQVAVFNDAGQPIGMNIAEAGIDGPAFDGATVLPAAINEYDQFPEIYSGKLFLGDFRGKMYALTLDTNHTVTSIATFENGEVEGLTDMTFNPRTGSLYYVNVLTNEVRRITYGGVLPPQINTNLNRTYGPSPLEVVFDSRFTKSYAKDTTLMYEWLFDDGTMKNGSKIEHTFESDDIRNFTVKLSVTDVDGRISEEDYTFSINNSPPKIEITSVSEGDTYSVDDYNVFPLSANVTDPEHASEDLEYAWRVDLYHNEHFHQGAIDPSRNTWAIVDPVGCGLETYWYRINLTVTDPVGLSTSEFVEIFPYCGDPIESLINLEAIDFNGQVLIKWIRPNDTRAEKYIVEKTDDYLFQPIQELKATRRSFYYAYDNLPFIGKNHYRVKAIDANGNYSFSNTVTIEMENLVDLLLFPNPVNDQVTLIADNKEQQSSAIEIFDMSGKLIYSADLKTSVDRIVDQIDMTNYAAGLYVFRVKIGDKIVQSRVLKR